MSQKPLTPEQLLTIFQKCPLGRSFVNNTYYDQVAYDRMIAAKTSLLFRHPMFGVLSLNLVLVEDQSGIINTLATDGRHIFYSAKFVRMLSDQSCEFAVGHEIYHCIMRHCGVPSESRAEDKKMREWGYATDFVINADLLESKVGEFITEVKILYRKEYTGWSSEAVYDDLIKHPEKMKNDGNQPGGKSGRGGKPGQGQSGGSGGEGDDEDDGPHDQHVQFELSSQAEKDANPVEVDGQDIKVRVTQEDLDALQQTWNDQLQQAAAAQKEAEMLGHSVGNTPAGIQRMLDDLRKPVVNWRKVLRMRYHKVKRRGYSFMRPNKNMFNQGISIPGYRKMVNELDLVVGIDTSGSMGMEQLTDIASELHGILQSFDSYHVLAMCWECVVQSDSVTKITRRTGAKKPLEDLAPFLGKMTGGGGTDPNSCFEWLKENHLKPKLLVMFTDGIIGPNWGDPKYCETLWVIVNPSGKEIKAPFGTTLYYDDRKSA